MQIEFLLGSMNPKEAAKMMADDIAQHIRTLCEIEHNAAVHAKTQKETRWHEGQASMARALVAFIESIEVVKE